MKINVNVSLQISPKAWDANYGTGTGTREVREDVQTYVLNLVNEHLRDMGVLA